MTGARTGATLVVAGAALVMFGVVGGFVFDEEEKTPDVDRPRAPTTVAARAPDDEISETAVRDFYEQFQAALNRGYGAFLFARLHPAVLRAYGAEQCRAHTAALRQPGLVIEIVSIATREPWDFGDRDGLAIPIDDATPVEIIQRTGDSAAEVQTAHLAAIGGEVRWFTDCGDPVEGVTRP